MRRYKVSQSTFRLVAWVLIATQLASPASADIKFPSKVTPATLATQLLSKPTTPEGKKAAEVTVEEMKIRAVACSIGKYHLVKGKPLSGAPKVIRDKFLRDDFNRSFLEFIDLDRVPVKDKNGVLHVFCKGSRYSEVRVCHIENAEGARALGMRRAVLGHFLLGKRVRRCAKRSSIRTNTGISSARAMAPTPKRPSGLKWRVRR